MDYYSQLVTDPDLRTELLDRFDELAGAAAAKGGLEGLERLEPPTVDEAARAVESMTEGTWVRDDSALEAIILAFTRPVYLVQDSTYTSSAGDFPDSVEIANRLASARPALERAIPSAGRVDLRNHRLQWAGTAWMVREDIAVTNRHVAEVFARQNGDAFVFRTHFDGSMTRATLDWRREYQRPAESRFRVEEVLWIEPDGSADVALLRVSATGEDGEAQPPVIELMTEEEIAATTAVAVIGYPARDSRNSADDQRRLFGDVYGVKRLAPGQVTTAPADGLLQHDATTLGGNSGSVLIGLETGKAAALHFAGVEHVANHAVQAHVIERIIRERAR
ncbi:serine protease [Acrocarpospora sp. B8E8]|uniref:trypsin-like serine peptidase n=1 Tax=Acrocarpospora sp. B8E8 TaxID=3153572 RepID=UPI00325E2D8D